MSRTVKSLAVKKAAPKTGAALSVVALAVAIVLGNGVEKGFAQPAPRGGALATRPAETGLARPGAPGTVEAPRAGRATEARRAGAVDALGSRGAVAPGVTAASTAGQRAAVAPVTTLRVRPANDNAAPVVASPLNGAEARLRALDTPANDNAAPVAESRPARAVQVRAENRPARPSGAVATTRAASQAGMSPAAVMDTVLAPLSPAQRAGLATEIATIQAPAALVNGRPVIGKCQAGLTATATENLVRIGYKGAEIVAREGGRATMAVREAMVAELAVRTGKTRELAEGNFRTLCKKCAPAINSAICAVGR